MLSTLLTILVLLPVFSCSLYSTEQLQRAVNSKCELRSLYKEHKQTHLQKHTRPPHEEAMRMEFFLQEIKEILKFRANEDIKWDAGLNFMADMTDDEMDLMRGYAGNASSSQDALKGPVKLESTLSAYSPPLSFDLWRLGGMVGPVHDQVKGSCWAHAAVVPLEAQLAYFKGTFQQLSIQELYDCTYPKERNAKGGTVQDAWVYVSMADRLGTWDESPEIEEAWYSFFYNKRSCEGYDKKENALDGFYIEKKSWVTSERDIIQTLFCTSPVTVGFDTKNTGLTLYTGGLYSLDNCKLIDHALVIVGYTEVALIIKNSWGERWGEYGYLMFDRKGPVCDMYTKTFSVTLEKKGYDDPNVCRWSSSVIPF